MQGASALPILNDRPGTSFPGIQIVASFEGTSLRMIAKPRSGYFMAQIDQAEPFKVAFRGERDSVATLATALPDGVHTIRLMYAIEGYEFFPEFWGFVLDKGKKLVETPALPSRKIEFIGNSITCGYGNEGLKKEEGFDYATENHYYSYASITARNLEAVIMVRPRQGRLVLACQCNTNIQVMPGTPTSAISLPSLVRSGTSAAISPMSSVSTSVPTILQRTTMT